MDTTEPKGPIRRRGLGRGLDALLGAARVPLARTDPDDQSAVPHASAAHHDLVRPIPLEHIQRGRYQPRRHFDPEALTELADSIRAQGVLQPIVVRPLAEPTATGVRYEIIAGERRWRAAQQAGLSEIPAVVRAVDERTALAIALIENIQRAALNPLEEAEALARLVSEFALTHQEVAEAVGRSRTAVTNALRLLDLNPEVKGLLASGQIEMGHARALLGLKDTLQTQVAQQVAAAGLSVRATERLVRRLQQAGSSETVAVSQEDPDIRRLQIDLAERLGARVQIRHRRNGKGSLVIVYESLDELDGILARIR
ncbi:ParB/RepB/Spo0J family partition protein [Caldichromatium japonicum]|uniref:Probable chromosome-partitioning protein ParB n=1 Tax=Caldichromatium japonicum TaxID=2699430 RepID=A0A6G7VFP9_9GAMM|nr:ParB/RepB/Spo0J family partition protein [Caldichromatium japonicum]QIK38869.1 ParB/RepB/Spo0J family partition protein [Caldichromatium japonicum]